MVMVSQPDDSSKSEIIDNFHMKERLLEAWNQDHKETTEKRGTEVHVSDLIHCIPTFNLDTFFWPIDIKLDELQKG